MDFILEYTRQNMYSKHLYSYLLKNSWNAKIMKNPENTRRPLPWAGRNSVAIQWQSSVPGS